LDKQNTLGVGAIKQSTLADNYSPVVNIREFGKYKGNGNGNMVINNSINPQRQRRM
jgi:hypothetical protein